MLRKWFAVLVMALVLPGCAEGEDLAPVELISVDGYELSCSWLLAENIAWEAIEETGAADLLFTAQLRTDLILPIFTMTMLQDQSDYVKVLTDEEGNVVPVGFEMTDMPPGLGAAEQQAFSWAQDEVYLLLRTLALRKRPEAQSEAEEEADRHIRVVTDWCEFIYPDYYADSLVIRMEGESLVFSVVLSGEPHTLFTLQKNDDTGHIVTMLEGDDGRVVVSFTMMTAPRELNGEDINAFYRAQGVVNEVLSTIALR